MRHGLAAKWSRTVEGIVGERWEKSRRDPGVPQRGNEQISPAVLAADHLEHFGNGLLGVVGLAWPEHVPLTGPTTHNLFERHLTPTSPLARMHQVKLVTAPCGHARVDVITAADSRDKQV